MSVGDEVPRLTRARLRLLQRLRTAKGRREQRAFLLDGEKLVREAIDVAAPILDLLSTDPELWADTGHSTIRLSQADAERLSETRTPQGHFAVIRDQLSPLEQPTGESWSIVALDGVQDAGNLGGIIRSAAAFGAHAVVVGQGSADPTHPRVVRAATGAWFMTTICRSADLASELSDLRSHGGIVLAADRQGAPLDETEIPDKVIWLFGNEGAGISSSLDSMIDGRIAVPLAEGVDSLNVNVAAGIILHHGWRHTRERSR
ncbi:MAG: RNA methyltransferase [Chloroflexi bacterium]|nr:RNA methyltransferase [Chloroflexota bacterium]